MAEEIINNAAEVQQNVASETNNLLDATQNAIIDAAENVSEVFETNPEVAHHLENIPFYAEVEFWVGMAFILAVAVLAKPLFFAIRGMLQKSVNNVIDKIDNAVKLRDDAQKLLADYERKFADTDKEVEQILQKSRKNIENAKNIEMAKLKENINTKEREVKRRIDGSTEKAQVEINSSISRVSSELALEVIKKHIGKTNKSKLIDQSIQDLDAFIK